MCLCVDKLLSPDQTICFFFYIHETHIKIYPGILWVQKRKNFTDQEPVKLKTTNKKRNTSNIYLGIKRILLDDLELWVDPNEECRVKKKKHQKRALYTTLWDLGNKVEMKLVALSSKLQAIKEIRKRKCVK